MTIIFKNWVDEKERKRIVREAELTYETYKNEYILESVIFSFFLRNSRFVKDIVTN